MGENRRTPGRVRKQRAIVELRRVLRIDSTNGSARFHLALCLQRTGRTELAVAEYAHWRLVFWGLLPLLVVAVVLTLPALRRVPHEAAANVQRRTGRSIQLALGAALALGGLTSGETLVAVGGVLLGGVIALPALRGLLPAGTLVSARGMPAGVMGMGLLNMGFFGAEAFVPFTVTVPTRLLEHPTNRE